VEQEEEPSPRGDLHNLTDGLTPGSVVFVPRLLMLVRIPHGD